MDTQLQQTHTYEKNLATVFRVLLSFLFLLSAVAKLYPSPNLALNTFEVKQLLPMGFSDNGAAHFSRIIIGCELALGIGLLLSFYFKKLVLPLSFLMLLIFSSHLTYEIISTGNKGNCGCFGSLLPMTPLQAVIKNVIAMGMIGYLFKVVDGKRDKASISSILALTFGCIFLVYFVGPIKTSVLATNNSEEVVDEDVTNTVDNGNDTLKRTDSTTTLNPDTKNTAIDTAKVVVVDEPKAKKSGFKSVYGDIDKGRKILCFFAPGCEHCKETAKELTALKNEIKDFPQIKIVFMDEEPELIPDFFAFAGAKYTNKIYDVASFWKTLGGTKDTPGVFYIWNGNIVKAYDGITEKAFKKAEFKTIVQKKWSELK